MEKLKYHPQSHLFICNRKKDGKNCCANRGSEKLRDSIKKWIKKEKLHKDLKVSFTSCLGYCDTGIAACLYPQNQWFDKIDLSDEEDLKKKLLKALKD